MFRCEVVTDEATMAAARAVRRRVFIEEQRVPEAEEWDAYDRTAFHFALWEGERVVGTARLVERDDGWLKIGRVAVLPETRGRGAGRLLMEAAMEAGLARGGRGFVLDAQLPVIPFYERLGFVAEGEVFMDAGIPHRRMWKRGEEP